MHARLAERGAERGDRGRAGKPIALPSPCKGTVRKVCRYGGAYVELDPFQRTNEEHHLVTHSREHERWVLAVVGGFSGEAS